MTESPIHTDYNVEWQSIPREYRPLVAYHGLVIGAYNGLALKRRLSGYPEGNG